MKVRIGSTKYEINKGTDKEISKIMECDDDKYSISGITNFFDSVITINSSYPAQTMKQTFWHETVHALLEEIGQSELSQNEDFVESVAKQLYGFHQDNNLEKIYAFLDK